VPSRAAPALAPARLTGSHRGDPWRGEREERRALLCKLVYHCFNASTAPVMARAALNMYTVDKSSIKHLAHQFGMYNVTFFVPVGQQKSFDKTCTFTRDIMVYEITRHTHKWATDINVWWAGGANDGKELWTSHDFESEVNYVLPGAPVLMKAGTGFKFRCNFDNTSDHLLRFGTTTQDEMCIRFGQWWDVTEMGHGDDQRCR
jgi:hypothetical protein